MRKNLLLTFAAALMMKAAAACAFTFTVSTLISPCPSIPSGAILVNATGGLGTLEYSLDGTTWQASNGFYGLMQGSYMVYVRDLGDMCSTSQPHTLPPSMMTMASISPINVSCHGLCDGGAVTTVMSGVPPYNYSWSTGSTTPAITGICAGSYSCTITDGMGCPTSLSFVINEPTPIMASVVSVTPANCGLCDGIAVVTASGGTGPYVYSLGGGPYQASATFNSLCTGAYTLIVQDANGCEATTVVTVTTSAPFTLSSGSIVSPGCGLCDGEVTLNVSGGTGPFQISTDAGLSYTAMTPTYTVTSLCAGVNSFMVEDASGCIQTSTLMLSSPGIAGLTVTPSITSETSSGLSDGSILLNLSGATGPFTFDWSNGATTEDIYSLGGGTYHVTILDGTGCEEYSYVVTAIPGYALITGKVYEDANNNCVYDIGELTMNGYPVFSGTGYTYTNMSGLYNFYVYSGTHTVNPSPSPYVTPSVTCPVTNTVTIPGGGTATINFPMQVISAAYDGHVHVANTGIVPGFSGINNVYVLNPGYLTFNGVLKVTVPQYTSYVSATLPPDAISGDTLVYNITALAPGASVSIGVQFYCPPTPSLLGTLSQSYAHLDVTSGTDVVPMNNTSIFNRIISGSYDPNEKTVTPAGGVELTQEDFDYYIQFQNTGNGPAVNITVTDTLSEYLDPSTIQIQDVSHDYDFTLLEGNIMHFRFNNIMLPDSTSDEPGSHGHIAFKIKQNHTAGLGADIENAANIYFDFNPPVITNTAVSTFMVITGTTEANMTGDFTVYPNPNDGMAYLHLQGLEKATCMVFDVYGRIVLSKEVNSMTDTQLDLSKLTNGVYTIAVSNEKGKVSKKLIRK